MTTRDHNEQNLSRRGAIGALGLGAAAIAAHASTTMNPTQPAAQPSTPALKGRINHSVCKWCYSMPLADLCKNAAAFGLNPEGGSKHVRFTTRRSHSDLYKHLTLTRTRAAPTDSFFLRAESFYNLATVVENQAERHAYDPDAGGGRSLHEQSHGESFLALVLHRLRGNGFYLFDEPEAALSPARQLALMAAMHRLVQRNSQFIVATHSPILLGYPGATIYDFGEHPPREVAYRETEHFQITRAFLEHPERMLRELLREDSKEGERD